MIQNPTESRKSFRRAASLLMSGLANGGTHKSHPEALDLLSSAFGAADWNTMSALLKKNEANVSPAAGAPISSHASESGNFYFRQTEVISNFEMTDGDEIWKFLDLCAEATPDYARLELSLWAGQPIRAFLDGKRIDITQRPVTEQAVFSIVSSICGRSTGLAFEADGSDFEQAGNPHRGLRSIIHGTRTETGPRIYILVLPQRPMPIDRLGVCSSKHSIS